MLYDIEKGHNGLEDALESILLQAEQAIDEGANIIILSDRNVSKEKAPIPALLACSFVNSGLQRLGKRSKLSVIIESAEPREVHHFALLFGFGASAINPYLVNEIIAEQIEEHDITKSLLKKPLTITTKRLARAFLR